MDNFVADVQQAIWDLLDKNDYIQPAKAIDRLAVAASMSPLDVKRALGRLAKSGWLSGVSLDGIPLARIRVLADRPSSPIPFSYKAWLKAMQELSFTEDDIGALEPLHSQLKAFPPEDLKHIISGLQLIRERQEELDGIPQFILSSRYLLGSSKLLGGLNRTCLKAFGINADRFPDTLPYLVVAGPNSPDSVVLIENPHSFESALDAGVARRHALVVTFGYGLSRKGDEYGRQLASLVENGIEKMIPLVRSGNPPPLNQLFRHQKLLFWGDLDIAGMQIFERVAAMAPHIQLSALYGPMIEAIHNPKRRHPYVEAAGKGKPGQKMYCSTRQDIQKMLLYCERHAVDQELVLPSEIELLAGQALDLSELRITPPA